MYAVPGAGGFSRFPAGRSARRASRVPLRLIGLLAIVLLPEPGWAQLFPSLPFDHRQFNMQMISADHLRLIGEVELDGDNYDFYADQVDIYLETSEEAVEDSADEAPPAVAGAVPDGADPAGEDTADDGTELPSLRLVASGNVVFSAPEVRLSAERVEYWTDDERAVFHEAHGWIDLGQEVERSMFGTQEPDLLFHGQMIERIGPRSYRITKGAFTSCLQPTPRWQLVATSLTLNLDSYAWILHPVLKVKGVPVFYLPGLLYPIQEDGRATGFLMPTFGASTYQGSSLSNAFFWALDRSQDATFYYDWFTQHGGDGRGAEYRYTRGGGSQGDFRMYRLNEPEAEINYRGDTRTRPERRSYELRGNARQGLPGEWNARAQVDYFTDITVRQTYNTNVFDASNSRRTASGNLSGPVGDFELSGTYDLSETFFGGTDSALNGAGPRIAFGRGKTELFGTPLYFSFDAEYARLLRQSTRVRNDVVREVDSGLGRFDLYPVLQIPFNRWPFLKIDSTAAWRGTYWNESIATRETTAGTEREQVEVGVGRHFYELATRATGPSFVKIWDTPDSGYSERMKHLIEPWAGLSRVSAIDDFERIVRIEGIDSIVGNVWRVQYGLDTRLYARVYEGGRETVAREILSASVTQSYYTDENAAQYDRSFRTSFSGTPPSNFSPLSVIVRTEPTPEIGGTLRVEFDPGREAALLGEDSALGRVPYLPFFRMGPMRTVSAEGSYEFGGWVSTSGGWSQRRFIEGLRGFDNPSRLDNYINSETSFQTSDNKLGGLYNFNYDIRRGRFLAQMIRLYYNAQCCGLRIDYQVFNFEGLGTRALIEQDRRVTLSFTLAGLGTFTNNFGGAGGRYR
ncbi:MAG: putative LPS assembly protein LptD [Acidobacteria bacterium]|nr:putative LPS assembly protein LptD [Acidobacteriota bacterium]